MKFNEKCDANSLKNPNIPSKNYVLGSLNLLELSEEEDKFKKSLDALYHKKSGVKDYQITLCRGTGCQASGEIKLIEKFEKVFEEKGMINQVKFTETGCKGFCEAGPLVEINPGNIFYTKVKPEDVDEIVEKTILNNEIIDRLLLNGVTKSEDVPFYKYQERRVLKLSGYIDPENINESIAHDTYKAIKKTLEDYSPEDVIQIIKDSGLRGRGGGGFSTGLKWDFTRKSESDKKYVICNADEGDPGAFMDRSIIEGDPHAMIEGMLIAGYAIGADEGYVYARAEYPLAIKRLEIAIQQAEEFGLLGDNIFGTDFSFKLRIKKGAGAFVCGEETALMASIEGDRGMPTVKPPFPAESGLYGKPTNINNVETFANVPLILRKGVEWYRTAGTEKSPGTKIFALTGKISNTGLVEVPFGITLRDLIYKIGGGLRNNGEFKAAQIGGPSGGCLTEAHLDLPLDFDSLSSIGAMVGSGGLVILDKETCLIETARFFMDFTQNESCGKCVPCREGTNRMLEILEKIVSGNGDSSSLDDLRQLGKTIQKASLCGLGKTAPNPVLSTLEYFEDEYLAHVNDKKCPAGECTDLKMYSILEDKCKGCTKCAKICPVDAIEGKPGKLFTIDSEVCSKCGSCISACPFDAIIVQ